MAHLTICQPPWRCTGTTKGMWVSDRCARVRRYGNGPPTCEIAGQAGTRARRLRTPVHLIPNRMIQACRTLKTADQRFHWSGAGLVGLAGLEPAASSLSGFSPGARFRRIAPATWANDVPLETAGDRCEPLGSDGVWTKRGPSTAPGKARLIAEPGCRLPLVSSGSGDTGVCLSGDNDAVRGRTTRRDYWVSYDGCSEVVSSSPTGAPAGARSSGPAGCMRAWRCSCTRAARTSRLWVRPAIRRTCGARRWRWWLLERSGAVGGVRRSGGRA